ISILALIVLVAGAVGIIQGLRTQSPSSPWTTYLRRAHYPRGIAPFRPASHGDWRAAGTPRADHGSRRRHEDRERAQRQARSGALVDNFQRSSITRPAGGNGPGGGGAS